MLLLQGVGIDVTDNFFSSQGLLGVRWRSVLLSVCLIKPFTLDSKRTSGLSAWRKGIISAAHTKEHKNKAQKCSARKFI